MSVPAYPERRADVRSEMLPDGSSLLYDPETHLAYALTSSAAAVWDACTGARSPLAIADGLAVAYDAALDRIQRDVELLLRDFQARGLLVSADESPA